LISTFGSISSSLISFFNSIFFALTANLKVDIVSLRACTAGDTQKIIKVRELTVKECSSILVSLESLNGMWLVLLLLNLDMTFPRWKSDLLMNAVSVIFC
jgi:hypothetical protein